MRFMLSSNNGNVRSLSLSSMEGKITDSTQSLVHSFFKFREGWKFQAALCSIEDYHLWEG